jgi:hypothetical protein
MPGVREKVVLVLPALPAQTVHLVVLQLGGAQLPHEGSVETCANMHLRPSPGADSHTLFLHVVRRG